MNNKMIAFVVLLGILVTLATGLLGNSYIVGAFPEVSIVSSPVLGVAYSGMPLPWMMQVIYPNAPLEIIYSNLIVDLIFWIAVVFVVKLFYVTVVKEKPKTAKSKSRASKSRTSKAKPARKSRPAKRRRR